MDSLGPWLGLKQILTMEICLKSVSRNASGWNVCPVSIIQANLQKNDCSGLNLNWTKVNFTLHASKSTFPYPKIHTPVLEARIFDTYSWWRIPPGIGGATRTSNRPQKIGTPSPIFRNHGKIFKDHRQTLCSTFIWAPPLQCAVQYFGSLPESGLHTTTLR